MEAANRRLLEVRNGDPVMMMRGLALVAVVLLALPLAVALVPVEAKKKKGRIVTVVREFSSGAGIAIPASGTAGSAGPFPATITVSGLKGGKITDVNVILRGFAHTLPSDVDMILAKDGRSAMILSDVGSGVPVGNLLLKLDDEAAAPLPTLAALTSGSFQPTNTDPNFGDDSMGPPAPGLNGNVALSTFDGISPNGQWQLFIRDDFVNSTGEISGDWALEITATVKKKKRR